MNLSKKKAFHNFFPTKLEKKNCYNSFKKVFLQGMQEDLDEIGDITSTSIFSKKIKNKLVSAKIITKQPCVLSGFNLTKEIIPKLFPKLTISLHHSDGMHCEAGTTIATFNCSIYNLLTIERVLLNLLQHLCGISWQTFNIKKLLPKGILLLDTRKTTPTFRLLEKYAVVCGGGTNHRFGLFDAYMVKDNHVAFAALEKISFEKIVKKLIDTRKKNKTIIVEVDSIFQLKQIIHLPLVKSDVILLDNMNTTTIKKCIKIIAKKTQIEVSGQITIKKISSLKKIHNQGYKINRISIGALTHSVKAIDLSIEVNI